MFSVLQGRLPPLISPSWLPVFALTVLGCAGSQHSGRYDALVDALGRSNGASDLAAANGADPFDGATQLDRAALVRAVLARNPTVESARHAWRTALARYPQETALDDPMVSYSLAPGSIGSDDSAFGQVVTLRQTFPFPGKLGLRGAIALAEAEALREDFEQTRIHLAYVASVLFDDYYVVERSLEINADFIALIEELRQSAVIQYTAGRVSQQAPLQAEVELAHLEHQRLVLETQREIVRAQLNGVLHRPPDAPLPAPPSQLAPPAAPSEDSSVLQQEAVRARPELRAAEARIRARESSVELAERQYYPDLAIVGSYNSLWMRTEQQFMLGLSFNIPIQLGRRDAAVQESQARVFQSRSDLAQRIDEVRVEVERARLRTVEALHVVRLYEERVLPVGRDQIAAARLGFETGRNSFLAVIDAQRSLRAAELEYEAAIAEAHRRAAELDRALGRLPSPSDQEVTP